MAGRIRTIKPELIEDEKTAGLDCDAFRLFIGLIILADDYGNMRSNPAHLTGQLFWCSPSRRPVADLLDELTEVGLITRYEVRSQQYLAIDGWSKHQKVDKPGKPRVPGPGDTESWAPDICYVYFIRQGEAGPVKVGRSTNVSARLSKLRTSSPHPLNLMGYVRGGTELEAKVHERLKAHRMTGEWFAPSEEVLGVVNELLNRETVETAVARRLANDSRESSRLTPTTTSGSSLAALEPSGSHPVPHSPPDRARSQGQGQGVYTHVQISASTPATSTCRTAPGAVEVEPAPPAGALAKKGTTAVLQSDKHGKGQHQECVDWFHQAFYARYGEYPTWTGPELKAVKELLAAHGVEAFMARATRMLRNPPAWMTKGGGALGIKCLRANFDAFAGDAAPQTAAQGFLELAAEAPPRDGDREYQGRFLPAGPNDFGGDEYAPPRDGERVIGPLHGGGA